MAAEVPDVKPDVLIVESTYGVQVHEKQAEREKRLLDSVERIVRRRGRLALRRRERPRAVEKLGDRHRALLGAQRVHGAEHTVAVEAGDHGDLVHVHAA